ncbi:putative porin [Membranihabitans maritimus]|uniref:putative porin n=1 Tax=Membranihabitans maritimus TaxID=2904244 RepID=UPI001F44B4A7|nr:putative porin [Membranihabitans maritimus]
MVIRPENIRILFLLCIGNILTFKGISQGNISAQSGHQHQEIHDTITYINYLNQELEDQITDTLLNGNFYQIDPKEYSWPYISQLGYSGSPGAEAHFFLPQNAGWNLGFRAFDFYRKNFDNLLFIKNGLPITKVTYRQTPQVNQSMFDGYFARKFQDLSFTIDHSRHNFTSNYVNQQSYNTIFHTGLIYDHKNWNGYILFASEVFQQSINGGITTDSLFGEPRYNNRISIPTQFSTGQTRDDIKKGRAGLKLKAISFDKYRISLGGGFDLEQRKITMNAPSPIDSNYYQAYQVAESGINSFINKNSTFPHAIIEIADSTKSIFSLESKTGINFNKIEYNLFDRKWQEIVQQASLAFNTAFFSLGSHLDLRVFDDNIYFTLDGEISGRWKGLEVKGFANFSRTAAPWVYRRLNISGETLWNNNPQSTFSQVLGGEINYSTQSIKTSVKVEQIFQTNLHYFDSEGLPNRLDQLAILIEPCIDLKLSVLHIQNRLSLQYINEEKNILGLPNLMGDHAIFIEDKWFKNRMHLNLGVKVLWKTSHRASYYLPYTQAFIPAGSNIELGKEYRIDPFFVFRVKSFKFYVRGENMNLIWNDGPLYDVHNYPLMDPTVRLGIEWVFRD